MRLLGQKLLPLLGVEMYGSGSSSSSSGSSHSGVPSDIRTMHPRGKKSMQIMSIKSNCRAMFGHKCCYEF